MNKNKFVPLGSAVPKKGSCLAVRPEKLTAEARLKILERQLSHMSKEMVTLRSQIASNADTLSTDGALNKDGIPIGTVCTAITERHPSILFYLTVRSTGYQVGSKIYDSLSSAAKDISGVRRSGWTFWKMPGGGTLKEIYKDK
jgi:hypothetical protein